MKITSAVLTIIQTLCAGPGPLAAGVVSPAGILPALSFKAAEGSALAM